MKPKTKEQAKLLKMSAKLPRPSVASREYAYRLCFPHIGLYYKRGEVWCQCCGHRFQIRTSELAVVLEIEDLHTCPMCGKSLALRYYRKEDADKAALFTVACVYKGYQVFRTFEVSRKNKGLTQTQYGYVELYQNWFTPQGTEVIIARDFVRTPYYFRWCYDSPMNIKSHNRYVGGYFAYDDLFDVKRNYIYRYGGVTKLLRRNGWGIAILNQHILDNSELIKQLLKGKDTFYEELLKCGQLSMLAFVLGNSQYQENRELWRTAMRICQRNGYYVKDASLYVDYLELLTHFALDIHNAHYVCPPDLRTAHDTLLRRKQRTEERQRKERQREELRRMDREYQNRMQRYLDLSLGDDAIRIEPLQSVTEFYEEGEAMHHCVYNMGYYDATRHPNSLILSAKDTAGNRIETIEVDIKKWQVVQSRAVCNGKSPYHDAIVKLVQQNIPLMKRCK